MLKKVLARIAMAVALTGMFLLGSLALGPVFAAQTQLNTAPTQAVAQISNNGSAEDNVQGPDLDDVEEQVGDQTQIDTGQAGNDATEVAGTEGNVNSPDLDNVENQVGNQTQIDTGQAVEN